MKWINFGMKQNQQKETLKNKEVMKTFNILICSVCLLVLAGCNEKKKNVPVISLAADTTVTDSTVYGRCGDGTAMHTLELITDKGDTVVYTLEGEDTCANVQGGLFVGDRLAVIGKRAEGLNEEMLAEKVINLTSLLGTWNSLDKNFEIIEGGAVVSTSGEPTPYTEWKILNGKLVLSPDTFDIYSLGPDSLYLENGQGIYGYKRMPKKSHGNSKGAKK